MGDTPPPHQGGQLPASLPYPSTHAQWSFPSGPTGDPGDEDGTLPRPRLHILDPRGLHRMAASLLAPGVAFGIILSTHSFCSWRRGSSQEPDS